MTVIYHATMQKCNLMGCSCHEWSGGTFKGPVARVPGRVRLKIPMTADPLGKWTRVQKSCITGLFQRYDVMLLIVELGSPIEWRHSARQFGKITGFHQSINSVPRRRRRHASWRLQASPLPVSLSQWELLKFTLGRETGSLLPDIQSNETYHLYTLKHYIKTSTLLFNTQ